MQFWKLQFRIAVRETSQKFLQKMLFTRLARLIHSKNFPLLRFDYINSSKFGDTFSDSELRFAFMTIWMPIIGIIICYSRMSVLLKKSYKILGKIAFFYGRQRAVLGLYGDKINCDWLTWTILASDWIRGPLPHIVFHLSPPFRIKPRTASQRANKIAKTRSSRHKEVHRRFSSLSSHYRSHALVTHIHPKKCCRRATDNLCSKTYFGVWQALTSDWTGTQPFALPASF